MHILMLISVFFSVLGKLVFSVLDNEVCNSTRGSNELSLIYITHSNSNTGSV